MSPQDANAFGGQAVMLADLPDDNLLFEEANAKARYKLAWQRIEELSRQFPHELNTAWCFASDHKAWGDFQELVELIQAVKYRPVQFPAWHELTHEQQLRVAADWDAYRNDLTMDCRSACPTVQQFWVNHREQDYPELALNLSA